jgi:hypothetical protein
MADIDDDVFEDGNEEDDVGVEVGNTNCSGFVFGGVFTCMAAGSEDCDWNCPLSQDIGMSEAQIIEAYEDEESA